MSSVPESSVGEGEAVAGAVTEIVGEGVERAEPVGQGGGGESLLSLAESTGFPMAARFSNSSCRPP